MCQHHSDNLDQDRGYVVAAMAVLSVFALIIGGILGAIVGVKMTEKVYVNTTECPEVHMPH